MRVRLVDGEGVTWDEWTERGSFQHSYDVPLHESLTRVLREIDPTTWLGPPRAVFDLALVLGPDDGGPLAIYRPRSDLRT